MAFKDHDINMFKRIYIPSLKLKELNGMGTSRGIEITNRADFATWKLKVLWFLGSVHEDAETVLTTGPITPGQMVDAVPGSDTVAAQPAYFRSTPRERWTEAEAIKFKLDSKIRSIIGNAVTVPILRKISHAKTAKAMWDLLLNDYEGVTVVKTQKRKNLIRCYENFAAEPKESLSDLHSRFQVLINDLESVGIEKTQQVLCQKFIELLPSNFESVITSMVISEKIEGYELSELFGILSNFEETQLKNEINVKKVAKDPEAALVATTKKNKQLFSSYSSKVESEEIKWQ
ncbi:uncharacterized protein [Rutidosis leptorrhynchoides]|uniref:uncharacterized protein n=1 Tax=Rutidosis leptorrhynchoides TaxID=125765 RepID=UPI003A98EE62